MLPIIVQTPGVILNCAKEIIVRSHSHGICLIYHSYEPIQLLDLSYQFHKYIVNSTQTYILLNVDYILIDVDLSLHTNNQNVVVCSTNTRHTYTFQHTANHNV